MIKAIFVDMDDTLIVNQVLYEQAEAMLWGYLRHFGITEKEVHDAFLTIDKALFETYSYSRERMPASFEAVLRHFVIDADAEMVSIVRDFAETIFNTVAKVKPGTPEAIDLLTQNFPVYIVTQGDKSVQEDRISHLPFLNELSGTFVVDKKSQKTFADIAQYLGFAPDEVVMIGDSLKSDIVTAVDAGLHAVWVEAHNSQLHEGSKDFPKERAYKFSSLLEAARHLVKYQTPAPAAPVLPSPAKVIAPPPPKCG